MIADCESINRTTIQLLLTPRQAAKALAISEKTLWARSAPRGPIPAIRVGAKAIRYSPAALQKWIDQEFAQQHKGM